MHDAYNKTRGIYEKFDRAFKSYEEGVAKAAGRDAFVHILQKIKAKPEECLFIDDLEKNVALAREVGMQGIVYTDLPQLQSALTTLGIH